MFLNDIGLIAQRHWEDVPVHFPHAKTDCFVVMPSHFHAILCLTAHDPRLRRPEDFEQAFGRPVRGSLGTIIGAFKASVTRAARLLLSQEVDIWQERFIDTRIRNQPMLTRFRNYIADNPAKWQNKHPDPIVPGRTLPVAVETSIGTAPSS